MRIRFHAKSAQRQPGRKKSCRCKSMNTNRAPCGRWASPGCEGYCTMHYGRPIKNKDEELPMANIYITKEVQELLDKKIEEHNKKHPRTDRSGYIKNLLETKKGTQK